MSRRTYAKRDRAYRRRMQREAEERRDELMRLEETLHREWRAIRAAKPRTTEPAAVDSGDAIQPDSL